MTHHSTGMPDEAGRSQSTRETAAQTSRQTRELADDLRDRARRKGTELKERAESMAEQGKAGAADSFEAVATALHAAGSSLREGNQGRLGDFGEQFADRVERIASYLRRRDVRALLDDLEDFGRRNPAVFLGTTFVGGLVLGRFLRSSSSGRRRGDDELEPTPLAESQPAAEWPAVGEAGARGMPHQPPLGTTPPMMSGGHNE